MKKTNPAQPTRKHLNILNQLCNLIPVHMVPKLARETGIEKQWRSYSPWSHVVSMIYGQLAHTVSLNDLCDGLDLHHGPLSSIRGASVPSRNNLSHANEVRNAEMARLLVWKTYEHCQRVSPGFVNGKGRRKFLKRFNRTIHLADSSVIELVASCMTWAKHRRRKAAAKLHLKLDLQSFLPNFAIVDTAAEHDSIRARELCVGICEGEIAIFDKAYVDFDHLGELDARGVYWVTRAKENMAYEVMKKLPVSHPKIVRDEIVMLSKRSEKAPELMRRIVARIEVDGKEREMVFLTNNLEWSPWTVCELYRARWDIEVFFKQIKQNLQISDFIGQSANAVRWQIWIALLVYILLRFQASLNQWSDSFNRLVTLIRSSLWLKLDLALLLQKYGTADRHQRMRAVPEQAYLPGFL